MRTAVHQSSHAIHNSAHQMKRIIHLLLEQLLPSATYRRDYQMTTANSRQQFLAILAPHAVL